MSEYMPTGKDERAALGRHKADSLFCATHRGENNLAGERYLPMGEVGHEENRPASGQKDSSGRGINPHHGLGRLYCIIIEHLTCAEIRRGGKARCSLDSSAEHGAMAFGDFYGPLCGPGLNVVIGSVFLSSPRC